jgi:hypothetical protein
MVNAKLAASSSDVPAGRPAAKVDVGDNCDEPVWISLQRRYGPHSVARHRDLEARFFEFTLEEILDVNIIFDQQQSFS